MTLLAIRSVIRNAQRNRLNSFINLVGLSVSIASCILISLFVTNEYSFDRMHQHSSRIYRIATSETEEGITRQFAHTYLPIGPLMQSYFPQIKQMVRLLPHSVAITNKEKNLVLQESAFYFADSNFFKVFSFGSNTKKYQNWLHKPDEVVLSGEASKKYFGTENAKGKQLFVGDQPYTVAGVINIPANSSIKFDVLAPISGAKYSIGEWISNHQKTWHHPPVYTFVLMENSGSTHVTSRLKDFNGKHLPDYLQRSRNHLFQPLSEIHFSTFENELQGGIRRSTLYLLIGIAVVILFLATFNFINLFFAQFATKLKGIGIQKLVGATRKSIWWHSFIESSFFLLASLGLAVAWVTVILPLFNELMERKLILFSTPTLKIWIYIGAALLLISLVTSVLPTFLLSRFQLARILKANTESLFPRRKSFSLQSVFLSLQFIIAIALMAATFVMHAQVQYLHRKDLGFQKEQTLVIAVHDEKVQNSLDAVKAQLLTIPSVKSVSAISNFPWQKGFYDFQTTFTTQGKEHKANAPTLLVDVDFIKTMDMKMARGRAFSSEFGNDINSAFIFNEAAAKKYGISSIQGVNIKMDAVASGQPKNGELIGIVKDFHLQSLYDTIQPLILTVAPEAYYLDNLVIRLSTHDLSSSIRSIEQKMKAISPGQPLDYFFLDEAFNNLYRKESRTTSLFTYFSIIAIVIACMGLFGIIAFSALQRTREVSIRKTLGASVASLVNLISRQYLLLVVLSALIALPIAWFFASKWLQDFAYHVPMQFWMLAVAPVAAIFIAGITVSFHSIKAALTNPAKILRSE